MYKKNYYWFCVRDGNRSGGKRRERGIEIAPYPILIVKRRLSVYFQKRQDPYSANHTL